MNYTGSNPSKVPQNNQLNQVVAVIPARYESVRLPGKALLEIAGKPMICWVVEQALSCEYVQRAVVATDDERIVRAVEASGYEAVLTKPDHRSGTDRIAEVARSLPHVGVIVNVQGDEPMIAPETIDRAIEALIHDEECGISTSWELMETPEDVLNPDVVKIVVDENSRAVYFSRSPVPYPRDLVRQHGSLKQALEKDSSLLARFRKHTGLYVFRREVLLDFAAWPQTSLERSESLEQLRALEHGVKIKAVQATASSIGVDTAEDLQRVRELLQSNALTAATKHLTPAV